MCVKEKKERGREIGRVYSTVSPYHVRVKRYFNSKFSNLLVRDKLLNRLEDGAIRVAI